MKSQLSVLLTSAVFVTFSATVAVAGLMAHWALDDGDGVTAADSVGGFDGEGRGDPTRGALK